MHSRRGAIDNGVHIVLIIPAECLLGNVELLMTRLWCPLHLTRKNSRREF